jgi:hypothetical protein
MHGVIAMSKPDSGRLSATGPFINRQVEAGQSMLFQIVGKEKLPYWRSRILTFLQA